MQKLALTSLAEDEVLFFQEISKFAEDVIGPKVAEMDEKEWFDPNNLKQCFDLGLMGIEIPEEFGGANGSFFLAILAVEALSKVDPSAGVLVDVQNTLVNNILLRWGNPEQKKKYLTRLAREVVGSYC